MQLKLPANEELLKTIGRAADLRAVKAWVVGGCVRDFLLNKNSTDTDVVYEGFGDGFFEALKKQAGGSYKTFPEFLTAVFTLPGGVTVDFAHARTEIYKYNGALPSVKKADIKHDLLRRDFTVNSVAASLNGNSFLEVYDPFNGVSDIREGTLRVLHEKSFYDDPTRLYRLLRFAGRFNWKADSQTQKLFDIAIEEKLPSLVSVERLRRELFCLLEEENPKQGFLKTKQAGLMDYLDPSIEWNDAVLKVLGAEKRFAVLMCGNKECVRVMKKLGINRALRKSIETIASFLESDESVRENFSGFEKEIITIFLPSLPEEAFLPRFVNGADVKNAGIESHEDLAALLSEMSKKQRLGLFKNRAQALEGLKSIISSKKS